MAQRTRKHDAKRGDLIEIFRAGYQHWAVYVGDDEVVHLTSDGGVRHENIWDVVGDDKFRVNNLWDGKRQPRKPLTIIKEAMKWVDKKVEYSVTAYNCEHFATELRYGKPESMQVEGAKKALVVGALGSGSAASMGVPSGPAFLFGSLSMSSSKR